MQKILLSLIMAGLIASAMPVNAADNAGVSVFHLKKGTGNKAPAKADIVVLRLEQKVAGKATSTVELLANNIDPNVSSVDDIFSLRIDGKAVDVPHTLLSSLSHGRRGYSYDHFTGGVEKPEIGAMCMLGGDAVGYVLSTRYLTYENHRIVKDEMKPVYGERGNCLFTELYYPAKSEAQKAVAKAMAILQTIKTLKTGE